MQFAIYSIVGSFFLYYLASASLVKFRGPTGLNNRAATCYMNSLLNSLYDVTPFRKAVYDHFHESPLIGAIAGVFARKQLNYLPAIDLERDMMPTVKIHDPSWEFGIFQDVDEFLKKIFVFFPESLASSIGYLYKEQLIAADMSYLINPGDFQRNSMVLTVLPPVKFTSNLKLQDMVNDALIFGSECDFRMEKWDHPNYFLIHDINPLIEKINILATREPKVYQYADVVPVFIARRDKWNKTGAINFRNDDIEVPEIMTFPLHDGQRSETYTLVSFVVYHSNHYFSYSKEYPSRNWYCYNDETVTMPSIAEVIRELRRNAVMIFYVKKGCSLSPEIPEDLHNWAVFSMTIQHMRDKLVPRMEKLVGRNLKKEH